MPTSPHQYRCRIRYSKGRDIEGAVPYDLFRHMLSDRPGGRGRPSQHCVDRYVLLKARADNIRPYIFAYVVLKAGASRAPSPTICSGRCCRIGREAEGGLPNIALIGTFCGRHGRIISAPTFSHMLSDRSGGRGRPPQHCVDRYIYAYAVQTDMLDMVTFFSLPIDKPARMVYNKTIPYQERRRNQVL